MQLYLPLFGGMAAPEIWSFIKTVARASPFLFHWPLTAAPQFATTSGSQGLEIASRQPARALRAGPWQKKPRACGGTRLRKETMVLPSGGNSTSTGKTRNRATVGWTHGLDAKNGPGSSEKAGLGGDPSHPHGVTGCPSTVGEFCARRLIKRDFPLVTEREEFIRGDDHRNYDGSLKFRGCPFALGILSHSSKERGKLSFPSSMISRIKRIFFAPVPRCKVHFPAP